MRKCKRPMVIYHVSQEDFYMGSKNRDTGKYPGATKWMWGHIVTNKATRTSGRYAILMDPQGLKAHYLTHGLFKCFTNMCEHVYLPLVPDKDVDKLVKDFEHLTVAQLRRVMEAAEDHPMYDEVGC